MASSKNEKVIVITGASAGLGSSLASEAAADGFKVALLARNFEKLEALQNQICNTGGEALALKTDVTSDADVSDAFSRIIKTWHRVDLLVNSAGVVTPVKPLTEAAPEHLKQALLTNVYGVYLTTRAALQQMYRQKSGRIVNITSGAANHPYIGWAAYGSQKAAVDMLTRIAAKESSRHQVQVLAISPGPFQSGMQEILRGSGEEDFPARQKFVDLYRSGSLPSSQIAAGFILAIGSSRLPALNGRIIDLRDKDFQRECRQHGITIPVYFREHAP
ncbi:MAG: SDR family oxidoreductase [Calditrichia bacterium]